jgi:hypothetical protein
MIERVEQMRTRRVGYGAAATARLIAGAQSFAAHAPEALADPEMRTGRKYVRRGELYGMWASSITMHAALRPVLRIRSSRAGIPPHAFAVSAVDITLGFR